jgi:hypothetical protein
MIEAPLSKNQLHAQVLNEWKKFDFISILC